MQRGLKTYQVLLTYGKREAIYECEAFDEKDAKKKAGTFAAGTYWNVGRAEVPEV